MLTFSEVFDETHRETRFSKKMRLLAAGFPKNYGNCCCFRFHESSCISHFYPTSSNFLTTKCVLAARVKVPIPTASQIKPKNMVKGTSPVDELDQEGNMVKKATRVQRHIDDNFPVVKKVRLRFSSPPKSQADGNGEKQQKTAANPPAEPLRKPSENLFDSRDEPPPDGNPSQADYGGKQGDDFPAPEPSVPSSGHSSNPFVMRKKDAEEIEDKLKTMLDITTRVLRPFRPLAASPAPALPQNQNRPPAGILMRCRVFDVTKTRAVLAQATPESESDSPERETMDELGVPRLQAALWGRDSFSP